MTASSDKAELRKRYRALRDAIPADARAQRSSAIARLLLTVERFEHAGSVFIYVSAGSEVVTHGLIGACLAAGKTVVVPRVAVEPDAMHAVVIRSADDLAPGRFGIPEPTTHDPFDATPDITLVPGLAFTRTGQRLGMGGGYYDRYLVQHPATYKIGLCFEEQLAEVLPADAHDVGMDEVLAA